MRTGIVCGWYPLSVNVAVSSFAATESAQGVRQVWPVDVLTSAPAGSDSNSNVEVAGPALKLGISKLGKFEQAPRARLEIAMTMTRRMMVPVISRGRWPHPR